MEGFLTPKLCTGVFSPRWEQQRSGIKRLQPQFNPEELAGIAADWTQPRRVGESDDPQASVAGFAPARGSGRPKSAGRAGKLPSSAEAMRLSRMTVYRLVHSGELPALRVGRSFRVPEDALAAYLARAAVEGERRTS